MKLPLDARIYVTGHADLVGSAIVRQLRRRGYGNIITFDERHFDLRDQDTVNAFFERNCPITSCCRPRKSAASWATPSTPRSGFATTS
jgi:GDP-L-fucose synthase